MRIKVLLFFVWLSIIFFQDVLIAVSTVLWEDNQVRLSHEEGFITVAPTTKVCHIYDLPESTFIAMEKTIGKMETVFEEVFGKGDYVCSMPLHDDAGIKATLIPSGAYCQEDVPDLELKIRILLYQLCDQTHIVAPISESVASKIDCAAKVILPTTPPSIPLPSQGIYAYKHVPECFNLLKETLASKGEDVSYYELDTEKRFSLTISKGCPFCNPEILELQTIYHSTYNNVLINAAPYINSCKHFLITPDRHISKISAQSEEEIFDLFQLAIKIDKIAFQHFNVTNGEKGIIITRNGWFAGQTAHHLHHHIIFCIPQEPQQWMRNVLNSFCLQKKPVMKLTQEQHLLIKNQISHYFLESQL